MEWLRRDPALEAAILEAPLDPAPRMVYGDWLAAQGDPRGEWFALSAAVEAAPLDVRLRSAATEVFNAGGALFLGDGVRLRPGSWFGWLGGFLDEARLQPFEGLDDAESAAAALFAHPHARFLRHVALGNFAGIEAMVESLAAAELPLLETVTLVDSDATVSEIDIDSIAKLPSLRRLGARGVTWTAPMPQLRELFLEVDPEMWGRLSRTTPNLEELTLDCHLHSPEVSEIAALVARIPELRRLRVLYHAKPDLMVNAFTPPPANLELLDLSHSRLSAIAAAPVGSWPKHVRFLALRTEIDDDTVGRLGTGGRLVAASTPYGAPMWNLQNDFGGETWMSYRARTEGRNALIGVPDAGRQLFETSIRNKKSIDYDPDLMEIAVSLPNERWHAWPWAAAASVRSWKYAHALCEATAREGLMREPNEPNFYAFITYALRKQGLYAEAAAEVPRAAAAIAKPPRIAQATGAQLCLIDCMFTLAQNNDYQGAIDFYSQFKLDDPNLQAVLAICYAATGQAELARAALAKAANTEGAADYVAEPNRRSVYDHAIAAVALLPPSPDFDTAMAAITRAWTVYPERNWFKTCKTIAPVRGDVRFVALAT